MRTADYHYADLDYDTGVFQIMGAGYHYLPPNSGLTNGTVDIDAALLARLRQKTVHPPQLRITSFLSNTTLGPLDMQDTAPGSVALGYHYPVLDYVWSALDLTSATLTLNDGVAVGVYGSKGTVLRGGAQFVSAGKPNALNRLVRYELVQEQSVAWGNVTSARAVVDVAPNSSPAPSVNLAFTDVSLPSGGNGERFFIGGVDANYSPVTCAVSHSLLRGVYQTFRSFTNGTSVAWTNNYVERSTLIFEQGNTGYYPFYGFGLSLYNTLFAGGAHTFKSGSGASAWTVKDNLFDSDTITVSGTTNLTAGYNGYRNGLTTLGGSNNKTNYAMDYQAGALGRFYYPTNGTNLATLINAGSRSVSSAGLSVYTTTTNNVVDSGNVDIGYHYYSVNPAKVVTIVKTQDAVEGGQNGQFTVSRTGDTSAALTVYYKVGGSAVPGVNYTALSGFVTIQQSFAENTIDVPPIDDGVIRPTLSVTATLTQTNSYLVGSPDGATVGIEDTDASSVQFTRVVTNLLGPIGIDYHSPSNSLIVSVNYTGGLTNGVPRNFSQISSNATVSAWSTNSNMGEEIFVLAARQTSGGWNIGDVFFSTDYQGEIGRITANPTNSTRSWVSLPDESIVTTMCFDTTGVFSNQLIAVTALGNVWAVSSSKATNLLGNVKAFLGTGYPEGMVTLPNDPGRYGPWAGKLLVGAETTYTLITVDTNQAVTPYNSPVAVENLNLIAANSDLYTVDVGNYSNRISNGVVWKLARSYFNNSVGDILVTEEAGKNQCILRWDGKDFLPIMLYNAGVIQGYEQATFSTNSFVSQ